MLLDLDSTLLDTYGNQEGEGFNFHYQAHGYHPLLCYDGLTGDLLKAELRDGTLHCSNDADKFMESLFQEYMEKGIKIYLRGDSGFMYQAGSWEYPRRVVFKIEKPYGERSGKNLRKLAKTCT